MAQFCDWNWCEVTGRSKKIFVIENPDAEPLADIG
jgi:hypothetical protein